MSFKVDLNETKTKAEEDREWLRCPKCGSETVRLMLTRHGDSYVRCGECSNEGTTEVFMPRRRTYLVRWEIEVDANSALEAAREAEEIQRFQVNREDEEGEPVMAGAFDVLPLGGDPHQEKECTMRVDLDDESVSKRRKV